MREQQFLIETKHRNDSVTNFSIDSSYLKVGFFVLLQVIKVDHDAHGVDTPEDVGKIEALMRERNLV